MNKYGNRKKGTTARLNLPVVERKKREIESYQQTSDLAPLRSVGWATKDAAMELERLRAGLGRLSQGRSLKFKPGAAETLVRRLEFGDNLGDACKEVGIGTSAELYTAWAMGEVAPREFPHLAACARILRAYKGGGPAKVRGAEVTTVADEPKVSAWRPMVGFQPEPQPESAAEVVVKGEPITEPIKSAAQAEATYRAHVTLRSGGTLDVTASEISVDDSGVLLEADGMSLAFNSQAVAEVTIKWEVR